MSWTLEDAIAYYGTQGAPSDQTALVALLREIQQELGGRIPTYVIAAAAATYGVKESFLSAVIRRYPSLHVENVHRLELCAGQNCGRHTALHALAEQMCHASKGKVELRYLGCQRMCGKGPNLKWDGRLYNRVDEALLKSLFETV